MGDPETRSFLTPPLLLFKENFSVSLSAGWLPLSLPLSPSLSLSLAGCGFEEANLCEWCGLSVVIALSQSTPFNLKRSFKEVEQSNRLEHSLSSDLSSEAFVSNKYARCCDLCWLCAALSELSDFWISSLWACRGFRGSLLSVSSQRCVWVWEQILLASLSFGAEWSLYVAAHTKVKMEEVREQGGPSWWKCITLKKTTTTTSTEELQHLQDCHMWQMLSYKSFTTKVLKLENVFIDWLIHLFLYFLGISLNKCMFQELFSYFVLWLLISSERSGQDCLWVIKRDGAVEGLVRRQTYKMCYKNSTKL